MAAPPGALFDRNAVDWEVVEEELDHVGPDYKQPKFHSLSHVVEILSSVDPQGLVSELRESSDRLETLIDCVVQGYHGGFAKSIQNYSQILHLFTEGKDQVDGLKKSLSEASRHLAAQSRHLHQQWKKSMQLASSIRVLDDIQRVVETPNQINAALAIKDWPAAVALLLRACSKLAQEELVKVGALRKLRSEMGSICKLIQDQVLEELHNRIYSHLTASSSSASSSSGTSLGASSDAGAASSSAASLLQDTQALSIKNRNRSEPWFPTPEAANTATASARHRAAARKLAAKGKKDADALAGSRAALEGGGARETSTPELVQCLVQIGSLPDAKAYISLHTRAEIRKLVIRTMEHLASTRPAAPPPPNSSAPHHAVVPRHVSSAAQSVASAVFQNCLHALRNMGEVLQHLANAPSTNTSAGLELLRAEHDAVTGGSWARAEGAAPQRQGADYIRSEYAAVWEEMQEECQLLLSELLHAPLRSLRTPGGAQQGDPQSAGWLRDFAELGERAFGKGGPAKAGGAAEGERSSKLSFRFEVTVAGLEVDRAWEHKESLPADTESVSYSKLLSMLLGAHNGTMYLTPAIYQPVTRFVDSAVTVLAGDDPLQRSRQQQASATSQSGSTATPSSAASSPPSGSANWAGGSKGSSSSIRKALTAEEEQSQLWLRRFVEDFVVDTFLPQVWVDLRGRCTAALEHPDAFKPLFGFSAAGSSRPILMAARFAEQLLEEVFSWAASMPFFASSLTGVVENILGRVLEGFQAAVATVVGTSKSARLAGRADVSTLMANEADAQLLDSAVCFYVPRSSDNFDSASFIAALRGGGALEAETAETEILQFMFRERPSQGEQLLAIAHPQRLMQLAALSESLDYVADAMLRLTTPPGTTPPSSSTRPSSSRPRAAAPTGADAMIGTMADLRDRYKALAGQCTRTLRCEMLLLCTFHLHHLALVPHVCEDADVREMHHSVPALTRAVTRAAEDTAPYLPAHKRAYVFGCVAAAATKTIMWLLPEITEINGLGVERMVRTLSVLQPTLAGLGQAAGEPMRPEAARMFDVARAYYTLVTVPLDEMLKIATDRPQRYNPAEWVALLQVQVPGRLVYDSHFSQMRRVMDRAYGNTAGQKVAAAFDQLRSTLVTAPAEQLRAATEHLTAGLQTSAQQLQGFFTRGVRGSGAPGAK